MIKNSKNYQIVSQLVSIALIIFFSIILINLIDIPELREIASLLLEADNFWGIPLFFAGNIVLYVLLVPSTVLGAASGVIFGLWTGIVIYSASCFTSSILTFLVLRFLFKHKAQQLIKKKNKMIELQSLAEKEGLRLLFFIRFLPVHATIINALLSVSSVNVSKFFITCLFLIPEWTLHVYIGYVASLTTQNAIQQGLMIEDYYRIISLIISIIAITYLGWMAQKVIRKPKATTETKDLAIIKQEKLNNLK
jgi:uncharacterized membrane protein YdjX (TVP38/TMEM64 family)